ncbi:MAG: hypothetical protein V7631_795, partial [Massilia sp.]
AQVDLQQLATLFDPVAALAPARSLAETQLQALRSRMAALDATHPYKE